MLGIAVIGKVVWCGRAGAPRRPALEARRSGGRAHKNARGLVELVILNIGLREGVVSPLLFTLFVLMALVTTAMTVPLLDILELRVFNRGHLAN